MTVVFSRVSLITTVMVAPTSVCQTTLGQHDVVFPSQLIQNDTGVLLALPLCHNNNNLVPDAFWGMYPLCHGFSAGEFSSFRVETCTDHVLYVGVLLSVSMWLPCSLKGIQPLGFVTPQPFRVCPWKDYVLSGDGLWPTPGVHWVAAPSTASSRGSFMLVIQLSPSYFISMVRQIALEAQQSQLIPLPSLQGGDGVSFSR